MYLFGINVYSHLCVLLHRCSPCPTMWQEGWFTSLVRHPATRVHSALQVLWRVHLCITSIWTSRVKLHHHSTKPCLVLPQVRRKFYTIWLLHYVLSWNTVFLCVTDFFSPFRPDPNMVNAYMYQAAGTNGQPAAPPGQAPPTTSPPYSNYQPTPTQGYQVCLTVSVSDHCILLGCLIVKICPSNLCHCSVQNVVSQAQSMPPMSQAAPTNGMTYMGYQPYSMQNMISALPGQDPNMPPQQPYMPGQQPMYQQVSSTYCGRIS